MDNITVPITIRRKHPLYYYTGAFLVAVALLLFALIFTFELLYGRYEEIYKVAVSIFALVVFLGAFLFTRSSLRGQRQGRLEFLIIGLLRFVTSSVILGYAFTKLSNGHMYASYAALDTRLTELNDFETVWSFYGRHSSLQFFIGVMELVPALLLLFRRTAFIGAVLMWPVAANVVLLNTYYEIGGLTWPVSILILLFTTYILFSYADRIITFLKMMSAGEETEAPVRPLTRRVMTAIKFIPLSLFVLLATLRMVRPAHAAPLKGAFELSEVRVNDRLVPTDSLPSDIYRKIYFEKRRLQSAVINAEGFVRTAIDFLPGDSLSIAYRRGPIDGYVLPDSAGQFSGKYKLSSASTLLLKGKQASLNIEARYKKLPLREFDYWWE